MRFLLWRGTEGSGGRAACGLGLWGDRSCGTRPRGGIGPAGPTFGGTQAPRPGLWGAPVPRARLWGWDRSRGPDLWGAQALRDTSSGAREPRGTDPPAIASSKPTRKRPSPTFWQKCTPSAGPLCMGKSTMHRPLHTKSVPRKKKYATLLMHDCPHSTRGRGVCVEANTACPIGPVVRRRVRVTTWAVGGSGATWPSGTTGGMGTRSSTVPLGIRGAGAGRPRRW